MRYSRSLLAIALIFPSSLAGQSVLGSSGLGMRLEALDATQRALGGVGVTTRAAVVIPGNPVASLDLLAPTITFTVQPHWGKYTVGADKGNFFGTRFPVLAFAYPLGTVGVFTLTAGSQFDQNWSVESRDSVDVGGGASESPTDFFRMGRSWRSRRAWPIACRLRSHWEQPSGSTGGGSHGASAGLSTWSRPIRFRF